MGELNTGKALYAMHNGVYVLKLEGEIRVPLCGTLDSFIERMFHKEALESVLIDLSGTDVIDSTALGLLAKIAIKLRSLRAKKPILISTKPDITRILDTMGFEKIFNIVTEKYPSALRLAEMPRVQCDEGDACEKVLEAHQLLMGLNERNHEVFKDVVVLLQNHTSDAVSDIPPKKSH